ncbi:MAG: acyltransferase family protein [Lachnospiraceae bacterium]|nr:acyltransferase family protein [Lachnospiraceae bacterium]
MSIILLIVLIVSLWGIRFRKNDTYEYLSPKQTYAINGIFVMFVFLRHFGMTISFGSYDLLFEKIDSMLGQLIVTTFLFYSGYGIMYSVLHKPRYIDSLPKRFLRLLFQFDLAVLLYLIVDFCIGKAYPTSTILLAFIAWKSVGNSTWYIFAILCLYVITYIFGKVCKGKHLFLILSVVLGCIIYTIVLRTIGKPTYWYDTILCFPLGLFYSLYSKKIDSILGGKLIRKLINILLPFILFTMFFYLVRHTPDNIIHLLFLIARNVLFVWTVVAITAIIKVGNKVLDFLGKYIFEIFILQRIPMVIFEGKFTNNYIYFFVCLTITIGLSILFRFLINFLFKLSNNHKSIVST